MKITYKTMALLVAILTVGCTTTTTKWNKDMKASKGLIKRLLPTQADQFECELLPNSDKDVFELESKGDKIIIRGNNANSMAVGLNHYLKYYCHTDVSWYVDNPTTVPKTLPTIDGKVRKNARCENRFFINYCTLGYTMPWWQWRDWEHFIDWMALNGVTMPLAITGQEAVWYRVWKKIGLSDQEIRSYFTGPAHLPWHRMANIDMWQGSLPHSWLDSQVELQKKIVSREREFNMTPVLPAFAGHVPAVLQRLYPKSNIKSLGHGKNGWGGFDAKYNSHFLDPLDPLFTTIQKEFLTEQTKLFGTDHIYGTDPFNEITPPSWEPEYLEKVGKTIYDSMTQVDPDAKWLQMTWVFYYMRKQWTNARIKAMVRSVPQDKMILLDYYCENQEVWKMTEKFFGQPYIWCYLGNFGGNTMLAGNLNTVEARIENTFKNGGDKMWGLGSTLEALDCNPMMYEYLFEKVWSDGPTDTKEWMKNYAAARCGTHDPNVNEAWQILLDKVYKRCAVLGQSPLTNARPTLTGHGNWSTNPYLNYDNKTLLKAWGLLLKSDHKDRDSYQHDVVNIGRQVLGNHFRVIRDQFTAAYYLKDLKKTERLGWELIELLDDMEQLLATRTDFMLGKWLEGAKAFAVNDKESKYYENNARTILTTWGEQGQSLNEYASRTWAGLIKGYYRKRWEMFVYDVLASLRTGKEFDQALFREKMTTFEWAWTKQNDLYSDKESGDSVAIATKLFDKYQAQIALPNTVSGIKIGGWNKRKITTTFEPKTNDISRFIKSAGRLALLFQYNGGGKAAIITQVELLEDGNVVAQDTHTGSTGFTNNKNVYTLELKRYNAGSKYKIRYQIKGDGGTNSKGYISMFQGK